MRPLRIKKGRNVADARKLGVAWERHCGGRCLAEQTQPAFRVGRQIDPVAGRTQIGTSNILRNAAYTTGA
jgi:hypothetical protein